MKRIKSIFFFFNFKIGAFLGKKRLKLHKCKKKSGSVQICSSEFLYPLYNHPLDVIVCCTSEGQNIFWFTFTHLNYASFLLKMIFFYWVRCWRHVEDFSAKIGKKDFRRQNDFLIFDSPMQIDVIKSNLHGIKCTTLWKNRRIYRRQEFLSCLSGQ